MSELNHYLIEDIEVGTPVTVQVDPNTEKNRDKISFHQKAHYQFTAEGVGTLKIEAKVFGQLAFAEITSISGEVVIIDLIDVQDFLLTATTADVNTIISPSS